MAEKIKMTESELEAMRLNALLNGADLSQLSEDDDSEDDFEIEIIEDKKPEKKKKEKTKKEEKPVKDYNVPVLTEFQNLKNGKVSVTFAGHAIPYKDQEWPVPRRTVEYQIELIKSPKISGDTSTMFHGNSQEFIDKARNGEVRYYKVVTYESTLPEVHEIGYAEVTSNDRGLKYKLKVKEDILSKNNCNAGKVKGNIESALKNLIQRN